MIRMLLILIPIMIANLCVSQVSKEPDQADPKVIKKGKMLDPGVNLELSSVPPIEDNLQMAIEKNSNILEMFESRDSKLLLSNVNFTSRTRIAVAKRSNAFVLFEPTDGRGGNLSRYEDGGEEKWVRNISLPTPGFDLVKGNLGVYLTSNGEFTSVVAYQDESEELIAIYNRAGDELTSVHGDFRVSADGKYFLKENSVFDINFTKVVDLTNQELFPTAENVTQGRNLRIFDNNLLAAVITEVNTDRSTKKRTLSGRTLFVYDLEKRTMLYTLSLKLDRPSAVVSMDEGSADVRGKYFVFRILEPGKGVYLRILDLASNAFKDITNVSMDFLKISEDGKRLITSEIDGTGAMKYVIRDLNSVKVMAEISRDKTAIPVHFVSDEDNTKLILRINDYEQYISIDKNSVVIKSVNGWFNASNLIGIVPHIQNSPVYHLYRIELEGNSK